MYLCFELIDVLTQCLAWLGISDVTENAVLGTSWIRPRPVHSSGNDVRRGEAAGTSIDFPMLANGNRELAGFSLAQ